MSVSDRIRDVLLAKADAIVRRAADRLDALVHPDFVYVNAAGRTFGFRANRSDHTTQGFSSPTF